MTNAMPFSTSTVERGPHTGIGTHSGRVHQLGIDPDELDPYSVWPLEGEGAHVHPWHDAKQVAARFESDQDALIEQLLPRSVELGDDVDDAGKLSRWHAHRIAESAIANRLLKLAVPRAKELQLWDVADRLYKRALAMLSCRQRGPIGFNTEGNTVIAWEEKCGLAKYCPDESQKEAKRFGERQLPVICDWMKGTGHRVYKGNLTLPNYPGGRLREGCRYLPKRFRNKIMRAIENGESKFPIAGALLIVEAPLGKNRDWNVHGNFIFCTTSRLDYKALRDHWGFDIHIEQHHDFTDQGMAGLFNELIKYGLRSLPDKSNDEKHRDTAPPMITWTGAELIEWDIAMHGYRRTRCYGTLYNVPKPDRTPSKVLRWLAYLEHRPSGYVITRRAHDLPMHTDMILKYEHFALDLVRGDKSTRKTRQNPPTGPP